MSKIDIALRGITVSRLENCPHNLMSKNEVANKTMAPHNLSSEN